MSLRLILCPLKFELEYIVEHFHKLNFQSDAIKINHYVGYVFPELKTIFAEGGHGKVQFGITAQKIISQFEEITSIVCAGAAGGLCDSLDLFDVVVGSETIEHDYREKFNAKAKRPAIAGDAIMISALRSFSGPGFKVHFDKIASGDEDIMDSHRAAELYNDTSAIAVAWEGIGGAKAGRFNKIPFLEIRAITDNARDHVVANFKKNLPHSMNNLAQVLNALIASDFS